MGLVAPGPVGVLPGEPGVGAGFWTGRKNVSDCFLIHSFIQKGGVWLTLPVGNLLHWRSCWCWVLDWFKC